MSNKNNGDKGVVIEGALGKILADPSYNLAEAKQTMVYINTNRTTTKIILMTKNLLQRKGAVQQGVGKQQQDHCCQHCIAITIFTLDAASLAQGCVDGS